MKPTKHIDQFGTIIYKLNGLLHRTDGPAIEYTTGEKEWWVNDQLHRLDGPAVEMHYEKRWRVNHQHHRLDGPAIEWTNGEKRWYVDDTRYYTEFEYWLAVQKYVDTHQTA